MALSPRNVIPDEEESYLIALLEDASGIDMAELLWEDPQADNDEQIFRAWDFQRPWWRDQSTKVIDQCARAVGKTMSIIVRGWYFPLWNPGVEMVVTAPELVHLNPLTSRIEDRLKEVRLTNELLPKRHGKGFTHRPFQVDFVNGAKILGRIPQKDGKGVKGLHPLRLEMDEAQDYPQAGWIELIETLKHGDEGAQWRAHGVAKGVRDEFYRHSQPTSDWSVHRITGMHRPNWSDKEREEKIESYGSRDSPDYRRNILGLHGDATNPLFVLHRLMACVDDDEQSEYNQDEYYYRRIIDEMVVDGEDVYDLVDPPASHKNYQRTWAGMDVGMTNHPSEILIFGEETANRRVRLKLLSRLHLERISSRDQRRIVSKVMDFYRPRRFTLDRTGLGLPIYQELTAQHDSWTNRIIGYAFNEKVVVGWDDYEEWEDPKDYEIKAIVQEYGYDLLRTLVDSKEMYLPFDVELLGEWQGQTWVRANSETSPYGKKSYAKGSFHTLDAGAMAVLGREMHSVRSIQEIKEEAEIIPIVVF
jgi:hypothetical protein